MRVIVLGVGRRAASLTPWLIAALLGFAAAPGSATCEAPCTVCWKDPVSGNWHDPTKWDTGTVPGPTDYVCIERPGAYTVTLDAMNASVVGLRVDGVSAVAELAINGVDLTLDGAGLIEPEAALTVTGGGINTTIGERIDVFGSADLDGADLDLDVDLIGSLTWKGVSSISGTFRTFFGCKMAPFNLGETCGVADLTVGSFLNKCQITLGGGDHSLAVIGGPLNNQANGVITSPAAPGDGCILGTGAMLVAELDNSGVVDIHDHALTIDAAGGTNFNRGGALIAVAGTTLNLLLGNPATASLSGNGEVRVGSVVESAGPEIASLMVIEGGSFFPDSGTLSGDGTLRFVDSVIDGDASLFNTTLQIELINTNLQLTGPVNNGGELVFEGTSTIEESLINDPTGIVRVQASIDQGSAMLSVGGGLSNDGTLELANIDGQAFDTTLVVTGGMLTNGAGATIESTGTSGGTRVIEAQLDNQGTINVVDAPLVLMGGQGEHVNRGDINTLGADFTIQMAEPPEGNLLVGPRFTNSGIIAMGSGTQMNLDGAPGDSTGVLLVGPRFTNSGIIAMGSGSQVNIDGLEFENQLAASLQGHGTIDATAATLMINDGIVSPGLSPGILTVLGDLPEGPSAVLDIEIGGAVPGIDFDRFDVSGHLQLDGTLDVSLIDPFVPEAGDAFEFTTFGSLLGGFQSLNLPSLPAALEWRLLPGPTSLTLEVVCGGPQVGVTVQADKDPVSIGYEVLFLATVTNQSTVAADGVVVIDALPATLSYVDASSSPECEQVGGDVECVIGSVPAMSQTTVVIAAEPVNPGEVTNVVTVVHNDCDQDPSDDSDSVSIRITGADPCDANYDGAVDADDLDPAVRHIYGEEAPGNPDCSVGGGINSEDLSKIVEEATTP